jgi:uncharacterized peroxidase-related enzyme
MGTLSTNGLPIIEESEATGEVAAVYERIKRELQTPFIPNIMKGLATAPNILTHYLESVGTLYGQVTLPQSLLAMISYTIATKNDCTYCSVAHEVTCRTLGVDADTLERLVQDLENVRPERIQAIIEFAWKVAHDPQGLVRADYDRLREQGVTDDEIVEIIYVAAVSVFVDTLADALQIAVDDVAAQALAAMN